MPRLVRVELSQPAGRALIENSGQQGHASYLLSTPVSFLLYIY